MKETTYGNNFQLLSQMNQYWNGRKTQQCVCDGGYTGYDCSRRMCPSGDDPDSSCASDAKTAHDIQLVKIVRKNLKDSDAKNMDLDQFVTLTFIDQFNHKRTTKPISFYDTARSVQTALISLPDFTIPDVKVYKFYPKDKTNMCGKKFYDTFQTTTCSTNADCAKFSHTSGKTSFFCDLKNYQCVESVYADCSVSTPTDTCTKHFSPDGIYELDNGSGAKFRYGRLTTAADRMCRAGLFSEDSQRWAKKCTTDDDCTRCGLYTNIKGGVCDSTTKVCVRDKTNFKFDDVSGTANSACDTVVFAIKFEDTKHMSTQGKQHLLNCNYGTHTNLDGHSPKFDSSKILSCQVMYAGIPEFQEVDDSGANIDKAINLDSMSFAIATNVTRTNSMISIDKMVAAQNFMYVINPQADLQSLNPATSTECNVVGTTTTSVSTKALCAKKCHETLGCQKFTHNAVSLTCRTCTGTATKSSTNAQDITYELRSAKIQFKVPADNVARQNVPYGYKDGEVALYSSYDEVVVCSNQGKCNFDTGICTCEDGYTGGACNRKNEHI